jgi:hypothetical protein
LEAFLHGKADPLKGFLALEHPPILMDSKEALIFLGMKKGLSAPVHFFDW